MKKVGIIGASGFIGSYVTKQFLESGFLVKASVTDLSRTQKIHKLLKKNLLCFGKKKMANGSCLEIFSTPIFRSNNLT